MYILWRMNDTEIQDEFHDGNYGSWFVGSTSYHDTWLAAEQLAQQQCLDLKINEPLVFDPDNESNFGGLNRSIKQCWSSQEHLIKFHTVTWFIFQLGV